MGRLSFNRNSNFDSLTMMPFTAHLIARYIHTLVKHDTFCTSVVLSCYTCACTHAMQLPDGIRGMYFVYKCINVSAASMQCTYSSWSRHAHYRLYLPAADKAYREMKSMRCSQSIIVSGEYYVDHMIQYDVMMTSQARAVRGRQSRQSSFFVT